MRDRLIKQAFTNALWCSVRLRIELGRSKPPGMNRLGTASSPYLRQHAANPVAWWPWGAEAFAEAKLLNKPVFVSIGYAACHWCHVMAHESFEDAETAALMNEKFINIKVDREERPDVDAIYMNAIMVQGEGGGWPLSAFCLPDGRPFYLGTYFPKAARFGKASFATMIEMLTEAYSNDHGKLLENADALAEGLVQVDAHYRGKATAVAAATNRGAWISQLSTSQLIQAGRDITERTDHTYGGLKGKPKFPSSLATNWRCAVSNNACAVVNHAASPVASAKSSIAAATKA